MEKIAKAISLIFHPLLIPSLGMVVLFNSGTYLSYLPLDIKKWILLIVFLLTYLVPLTFIPFFLYQKVIMNIQMESRKERFVPLAVSLVMYIVCFLMIRRISIPHMYHSLILSSMLSILATMLITIKYKVSIHMVGAGGLVGLIGFLAFYLKVDLQFYLGISVVLAGLIGMSRIFLKAHSPTEIYMGFLTGFLVVLVTLALY